MSYWCDNPHEHRREGERDFERHGRYGYDDQQYHDSWNDCSKYYREGFDQARREHDRREELRQEEEQAQAREERRRAEQAQAYRDEEERYVQEQEQQRYEEQQAQEPMPTEGDSK